LASAFYDAGKVRQIANTLFLGWGYNFYRLENQLRADDQLARAKAAWLLGQAAASIQAAEADLRRETLAPPTRANPYPDPAAVADVQALERLSKDVVALEGRLHALPAPEQDLMSLRFRQEADTLARLIETDEQLVGQAELLRSMVDGQAGAWIIANMADLREGLAAIQATLREREGVLEARTTG
jgi:hypothetical protein